MHIIVASSNVFRRELSSYILSEAGYIVHEASDSSMLLRLFDELQPALLLLDSLLNGLSWSDLLSAIGRRSRAPILALVGTHTAIAPDCSLDAADHASLVWPYQPDELLSRVCSLLCRPAGPADVLRNHERSLHAIPEAD